jgi:hypothetical protein
LIFVTIVALLSTTAGAYMIYDRLLWISESPSISTCLVKAVDWCKLSRLEGHWPYTRLQLPKDCGNFTVVVRGDSDVPCIFDSSIYCFHLNENGTVRSADQASDCTAIDSLNKSFLGK